MSQLDDVGLVHQRKGLFVLIVSLTVFIAMSGYANAQVAPTCERTVTADVVALDQVFFWNRLGVVQPQGMMYALLEDVESIDGGAISPGNVKLRVDKRPRPIVLRMNVGDCLQINFTNLLNPTRVNDAQPASRLASIHISGLQLVNSIMDDGTYVGRNASSLVAPGGSRTYTYFGETESVNHMYSGASMTGGEGDSGSISAGLFGAVNVEPRGAVWLRSQVTNDDIELARIGTSAGGHPLINYDAVYPAGHKLEGRPIYKMLDTGNNIRHTDLNAIIAGPGLASFPTGTYPPNAIYPDRDQSFREFTIIYHGEIGATQAFPIFDDPVLGWTLASVVDGFAINYGTGGIGAEIVANRVGVGPMWDCNECKYEEFFLSAWAMGEPAMIVDIPANAAVQPDGTIIPGPQATKALYPDDPSNVHHSYIGDHVKMRLLHGGPAEHHIHHLHAHQWLYSPDSSNSAYLDSQAIGPGSAFTLEIPYGGSGNRNQTVGDSIFHCHFYPHFAQGMWELWRTHDVFEEGTPLDINGRPMVGSRALPDPEIVTGTPIPAIVPIPGLVMPPMPQADVEIVQIPGLPGGQIQVTGAGNPGYPFFIAAVSGHRPSHPPMDTIHDGGLPRHVITGGESLSIVNRLDFTVEMETASALQYPEDGTDTEKAAMAYHATRWHPSYTTDGTPGNYKLNGLPPQAGAPYADPCMDDLGNATGVATTYKGANIEIDAQLTKNGWHFPQTRIISLWEDVASVMDGTKAPEPLFMRVHTNDCVQYEHTNLTPNIYELDDFQVRTPTDILGQHIHLVKFDVTSSDGSGNGWNYEDGTFSPDEVRERIHAIRAHNVCVDGDARDGTFECPIATAHPFFGAGPNGKWLGAQTTIQRWYADDVLNNNGTDRTLRSVFTHDHYGPSTHQQVGLYAGLLLEPEGSTWRNPETGVMLGTRADGGPTSFNIDVLTVDPADSYREFMLEFADFQLAYKPNNKVPAPWTGVARQPGEGYDDPPNAINPPSRMEAGLPDLLVKMVVCPGGVPLPCPEAISADDPGLMSVNYRSEPIALRVHDPVTNSQAAGDAGDLALAFRSDIVRAEPALNSQPGFYPPLTGGVQPGDPYTPLMRVYDGDKVQIRTLVGATEELHNLSINGIKWLAEPEWTNSGYRNSQMMGISEHFEYESPIVPTKSQRGPFADYLYKPGSSTDDLWTGTWGILRSYKSAQADLLELPNNPAGGPPIANAGDFDGICPRTAPIRQLDVTAVLAADALPGGTLVYNSRTQNGGPLNDPTAIMYVRTSDLDANGKLKPGAPVEPLTLRAIAGECIQVTLRNNLPATLPDLDGWSTLPMIIDNFNANDLAPSSIVGLHPQLLSYDITRDDGQEVGFNPKQTVMPGQSITYDWYAGNVDMLPDGTLVATPIEFGTTGLIPADQIKQPSKGLVGSLIIEPIGSTWVEDPDSYASATVTMSDGTKFREFVLIFQSDINMRKGDGTAVANTAGEDDSEDSGAKAFNYRSEPMWLRMGHEPDAPLNGGHAGSGTPTKDLDFSDVLSNSKVGGDPETPVFEAKAGMATRFRIAKPGGNQRNHVFAINGHSWQYNPYVNDSKDIGDNPLSIGGGAQMGIGPSSHFDCVLRNGAGGKFGIQGDYLYRDVSSFLFDGGLWGIFRVGQACDTDADCNDGVFCNGAETCDADRGCQAGDSVDCNDDVFCSIDSCDEVAGACSNSFADTDGDGVADGCDNCPDVANAGQVDQDSDGVGDACDPDLGNDIPCIDGDPICDECLTDPEKVLAGWCGCGVPDTDSDGDTVPDCIDICAESNDLADADGDGVPDGCDACPVDALDDSDGDGVCDSDDVCPGINDFVTILVDATAHHVGSGSYPDSSKTGIADIGVCAYDDAAGSCVNDVCGGFHFSNYECIATTCPPVSCCTTDVNGACTITAMPGDYAVVAFDSSMTVLPDPLGKNVGNLSCGDITRARLRQIIKSDGKKVPGKTKRLLGSELLIVEQEFVIWDTTEQLYPFVFEAVGDWGVETVVAPPDGFISDYDLLAEYVFTGTEEAVQFTVTEIGSDLVPTGTTFNVNHNGKSQVVHSDVDIRLTAQYARQRGFDVALLKTQGLILELPENRGRNDDHPSQAPGFGAP